MAEPRPALIRGLRSAATWAFFVLLLATLEGWWGLVTAVVVAAGALARVEPRSMMALGAVALFAVPLAVLLNGLPVAGEISSSFALDNFLASQLAFVGVALVVYGGLMDVRRSRRPSRGEP